MKSAWPPCASCFPRCSPTASVNVERLRELLAGEAAELGPDEEHYGLRWPGQKKARQLANRPATGTLRTAPGEGVDEATTQNLLVVGDNLEVLRILRKSYEGRVKLIYIDPPYNTGNDFIYKDDFGEPVEAYLEATGQRDFDGLTTSNPKTSGRFHSAWLSFMHPRLTLARHLLRADGIILISIDDNEVQNLRMIMDEVFGAENFIATVIWQKAYAPKNSARHFSEDHDFILVYAKHADSWSPALLARSESQLAAYKNPDDDPRGPWKSSDLGARNYYSKGTYSITCPSGRVVVGPPPGSYWRVSEEKFLELDQDKRIWWGKDGNNVPAIKRFLSEVKAGRVPQTLWKYEDVGHSQEAKKQLIERVTFASSDSVFDTPKPTRLIEQALRIGTSNDEDTIVLDFFAGSGTTGEAVMKPQCRGRRQPPLRPGAAPRGHRLHRLRHHRPDHQGPPARRLGCPHPGPDRASSIWKPAVPRTSASGCCTRPAPMCDDGCPPRSKTPEASAPSSSPTTAWWPGGNPPTCWWK
jgi:adenine-specific DNA-methyltransferase